MALVERVLLLNPDLTATQAKVLPANPVRKHALFVNDSDAIAYLSLGSPAAANQGIRLNASGGSYELNVTNLYHGDIYAISVGATKRLCITEVSLVSE